MTCKRCVPNMKAIELLEICLITVWNKYGVCWCSHSTVQNVEGAITQKYEEICENKKFVPRTGSVEGLYKVWR